MCGTIKKDINETGFSLIELAIVMVLIGLVMAPAISLYHNYRVDKDWKETEKKMNIAVNEIGGFRSIYSRYPCPASQTAVPGDLFYGYEYNKDCTDTASIATGSCVNGVCAYSSNIAGKRVIVGSLPFKTINLSESDAFDTNLNRFRYAVTEDLTMSATFSMSGGGVGIIDKTGASIIDQPDTAHFTIISHGSNKISGYTRAGVQSATCASATPLEQENCDGDGVFSSGEIDNDFDDRIKFFSNVMPSEWQISANDRNEIHLKGDRSFAVGVGVGTDLSAAETGTIRTSPASTGSIKASNNFYSATLCEYGASGSVDCFAPRLIAGSLNHDGTRLEAETTSGSGMSCYKPSLGEDKYLVGIEDGKAICEDEIFVSCPSGSFIKGIDVSGKVTCDSAPDPRCENMDIVTTCGDDRTLTGTYSGGYSQVYSGECRMITDYNSAYFANALAGLDLNQIEEFIYSINAEDRTVQDCGPSVSKSQVRDTYQCSSGTWNHVSAHEKLYYWWGFPSDPNAGGSWPAETSYTGTDPNNNNGNHDCWCREDYKVTTHHCPSGFSGQQIYVQKHKCPQTSHRWQTVYTDSSQCICQPGITTTTKSCNEYYDEVNGTSNTTGLSGNVTLTYDITCEGNVPVTSTVPSGIDTSGCFCPSNDPYIQRSYCPTGTTNSWSWSEGAETGVEAASISNWTCPTTTSNSIPDPGSWGAPVPHNPIPACVCDESLKTTEWEACPSNLHGTGITYEKEWDCVTGTWEPEEDWEVISKDCNSCSWTAPSGSPSIEEYPLGGFSKRVGNLCRCDSGPSAFCWSDGATGYDVWTNCQCTVQIGG